FTGGQDVYFSRITVASSAVNDIPAGISVMSATPNPFQEEAVLKYYLASDARVRAQVYDRTGQLVRTLADQQQNEGTQQLRWNGSDDSGQRLPAGIYFCRLSTDGHSATPVRLILAP
ncbi:MAG: FlgD immunoglobulin-like domain containing protein, partial [Bacteroidota bacterium]